jgi:hypothetical protein
MNAFDKAVALCSLLAQFVATAAAPPPVLRGSGSLEARMPSCGGEPRSPNLTCLVAARPAP